MNLCSSLIKQQSQQKTPVEKSRSKKGKEPKPRVKKLKYHQYVPPDQKHEASEAPMDSSYARLLQQQQLFLQLQILSQQQQHYNYQTILPAPLKYAPGYHVDSVTDSCFYSFTSVVFPPHFNIKIGAIFALKMIDNYHVADLSHTSSYVFSPNFHDTKVMSGLSGIKTFFSPADLWQKVRAAPTACRPPSWCLCLLHLPHLPSLWFKIQLAQTTRSRTANQGSCLPTWRR